MTDARDGFHLMRKISAAYEKRDVHKGNHHRNFHQRPDPSGVCLTNNLKMERRASEVRASKIMVASLAIIGQ